MKRIRKGTSREKRMGPERLKRWPLLSVETSAMGTRGVHMKGILPCLVHWACRYSTRDLSPTFAACCSSQHSRKYFFLRRTLFHSICPHHPASWSHSCAGILICVSGWGWKGGGKIEENAPPRIINIENPRDNISHFCSSHFSIAYGREIKNLLFYQEIHHF